jgi:hypothetical protein
LNGFEEIWMAKWGSSNGILPRTSELRSQVVEVEIQKNCHGAALLSIAQVYDAWCVWPGISTLSTVPLSVGWWWSLWKMLWGS